MQALLPAVSAVLQAASFSVDKAILSIKKVTYKTYNGISFPLIALFSFIIFLIFRPTFNNNALDPYNLLLLAISIFMGIMVNIIFYRALKSDLLSEIETISLMGHVPLIIFASIFFVAERNYVTIALSLLATLALIWSHWEKHHFHIAKKTWPYLIWTVLIAPFSGIISKTLLEVWPPITYQLVRDGAMALVFLPLYFKNIRHVPKKAISLLLITNILTTIAWIIFLTSYKEFGIVYTTLIFALQPTLVYFASLFFFKEKVHAKKIAAFFIILAAIILAQFF